MSDDQIAIPFGDDERTSDVPPPPDAPSPLATTTPAPAAREPSSHPTPSPGSPIDPAVLLTPDGALRRELPDADGGGATFSERQAAAIVRRGETLVSAGAGAGKTSVLVERYLRLLEGDDRLSTGAILAITFTDKAAAEMRERVRERLAALIGDHGELPERWRLEDAWIGTFHGIAQRLLRRHALAAGLDPDLAVADEAQADELRTEAFEQALAAWLRDPAAARGGPWPATDAVGVPASDADAALALAAAVGTGTLQDETLKLLALRRTQGRDPGAAASRGDTALPIPEPFDRDHVVRAADELRETAVQAADEARERWTERPSPAGERALVALVDVTTEIAALAPGQMPDVERILDWTSRLPQWRATVVKGPAVAAFRAARDHAEQAAWSVRTGPAAVRDLRLREALLVATARRYRRVKREQATLDFDDLLLALLELLRRDPDIAALLRGRFRQVLVDEYQDTNPVQLELVERLSSPDGRFQVGDRLQAIYGFRHATVAGFDAAAERAQAVDGRLELDETFRCRVDVLAVANRVGSASHRGYQPLVGGHDRPLGDDRAAPPVEVHLLAEATPDDAERDAADPDDAVEPDAAPGEAEHVAAVVAELVAAGRGPGEIAILVRRTAPVPALERALLAQGIDALPVVAAPLLEALEVRELESWLRAVANPHDDVALLGALRLPSAGIDADALVPLLAEHRARYDERAAADRPSLWETLLAYDDPDFVTRYPISERARDDLDQQLTVLRRHRALARRCGPAEILAQLRADDGYRASVLSRPGGVRRWAGVDAFVDWVEEQEQGGDDLVRLLDRIARRRNGPDAPVLSDGEAVRITTIHRSKGLEWPVVICCDLGSPVRVVTPGVLVDPDPMRERIGLRLPLASGRDKKLELWDFAELRVQADRAQAEEERRLLHVAMTRAKYRLILCGAWDPEYEGSGLGRRSTGRLRADLAQPVTPGEGHDRKPSTAPLRWLLPLIAPPESWPACGEQRDLTVEDPTGATARLGRVRIAVVDPADTPPPTAGAVVSPAVSLAAPRDEDGPPLPRYPLPDPVSYSSLSARLGLAVADDEWRPRPTVDEDEDEDEGEDRPVPAGAQAADAATLPTLFTTAALDGRLRGAVVHRLIERRLRDPAASPPTADDVRGTVAEEAGDPPIDDADAEALIAIASALERTDAARTALSRPAADRHVERPFLFDPEAGSTASGAGPALPLVHGLIDLWLDDGDGVLIVDWKTNALAGATPAAIVDRHYALQRDVYALAALLGGARLVRVSFVFSAAPERPVEFAFTQADRDVLAIEVCAAIRRAQDVPPAD